MRTVLNETALRLGPIMVLAAGEDGDINNPVSEDGNAEEKHETGDMAGEGNAGQSGAVISVDQKSENSLNNQETVVIVDTGLQQYYQSIVSAIRFQDFLLLIVIMTILLPRVNVKRWLYSVFSRRKHLGDKTAGKKTRSDSPNKDDVNNQQEKAKSGHEDGENNGKNGSSEGPKDTLRGCDSEQQDAYKNNSSEDDNYDADSQWWNKSYLSVDKKSAMGDRVFLSYCSTKVGDYILSNGNEVVPNPEIVGIPEDISFFEDKGIDKLFNLKQGGASSFYLQNEPHTKKIELKKLLEPAQVRQSGRQYVVKKKGTLLVEVKGI